LAASYLEEEVLLEASYLEVEVLSFLAEVPCLEVAFLEVEALSLEEASFQVGLEVAVSFPFLVVVVLLEALSLVVVLLVAQALVDIPLEVLECHVLVVAFAQVQVHQHLALVHSIQEELMS